MMATPVYVFAEIAARYGVDATDETAVEAFFAETVPGLSEHQRQSIFDELISRDGEPVGCRVVPGLPTVEPVG